MKPINDVIKDQDRELKILSFKPFNQSANGQSIEDNHTTIRCIMPPICPLILANHRGPHGNYTTIIGTETSLPGRGINGGKISPNRYSFTLLIDCGNFARTIIWSSGVVPSGGAEQHEISRRI